MIDNFTFLKDLVLQCLESDPSKRPTARQLLFHPALFEIPTLKLLSVHSLADDIRKTKKILFLFLSLKLIFLFFHKVGSKPDRSFVTPFHHTLSKDQVFAEVESIREGCKPVIFTYAFIHLQIQTLISSLLSVTKIVHHSIWINFLKMFKMVYIP